MSSAARSVALPSSVPQAVASPGIEDVGEQVRPAHAVARNLRASVHEAVGPHDRCSVGEVEAGLLQQLAVLVVCIGQGVLDPGKAGIKQAYHRTHDDHQNGNHCIIGPGGGIAHRFEVVELLAFLAVHSRTGGGKGWLH